MGEEVAKVDEMTKIPSPPSPLTTTPHHFVMVHGAGHGAWCWYKVRTELESFGHTVTCLDLKASGIDPTRIDTVLSFRDYNQPLVEYLSALPPQHKVILVGHSAGGMSVGDAINKFPQKIKVVVFVAATMLPLGFQTPQDLLDGAPDLSEFGSDAVEFGYGKGVDQPPTSAYIKPQFQRNIFYQLCPIEDSTLASMLMRPFPLTISEAKWDENDESKGVSRVYIKTSQDRVLKPGNQDVMIMKWPPSQVYTIDTDHSPFFSASSVLSSLLAKVALSL